MITPYFELQQLEDFIKVIIRAPYTRVSDVEIVVEENSFYFYAKPYMLRLQFPGNLDEEDSSCVYDSDIGNYTVTLKKVEKGQSFGDLHLLTRFCAESHSRRKQPAIEELHCSEEPLHFPSLETCNWERDICPIQDSSSIEIYGYGFANQKSDVLANVEELALEIMHIENPCHTEFQQRQVQREESEDKKFDSDYYLADLYENEKIQELLLFVPWWSCDSSSKLAFSEDENKILQKLPNRQYLLNETECQSLFLGLVDILFAYAYNVRVTEGEENVESAWNIRTISPTLSWSDTGCNICCTIVACIRRSLCYPQHRNWELSNQIKRDVVDILKGGKRVILRCLLHIWLIFSNADCPPCYILNDLFITDYCVWIQRLSKCDKILSSLVSSICRLDIMKKDIKLDIDLIERAAELVLSETSLSCTEPSSQSVDKLVEDSLEEFEFLHINQN